MSKTPLETQKLIKEGKHKSDFRNFSTILAAAPNGASQWASTFNTVAIFYDQGMWLIGPVLTGAVISVSDETVSVLASKYPENDFLQSLKEKTFLLNHGLNRAFADFGFAWSLLRTVGVFIGGVTYASNDYGRLVAPILVIAPAIYSTFAKYKRDKGELEARSYTRHAVDFFRGSIAPMGPLGVLSQQGILGPDSYIPMSLAAFGGGVGLTASLLKESLPKLSISLNAVLEFFFRNASLASAFFHFPLDIYAAEHEDEIPEAFFYSVVGMTTLFFMMLTINSSLALYDSCTVEEPTVAAVLEEVVDENPSINDDLNPFPTRTIL